MEELADVLQNKGIKIDIDQLFNVISEIDYYGNKEINYSDFLSLLRMMRRIVARIVSVFFCLLANSWSNLEVLFSLNPSEGQGKNHPSKFRVSHFIADSK